MNEYGQCWKVNNEERTQQKGGSNEKCGWE